MKTKILITAAILLLVLVGAVVSAFVTMLLWNYLAGYFGFRPITLLIAFFINVALSGLGAAIGAKR